MTEKEFLRWEQDSRDTIDLKRIYCDMAGGLVAGVMLSQIIFWNLPTKKGQTPKLQVRKDGHYWLAKNHGDWWYECRVSPKQAALALDKMQKDSLIVVKNSMFSGKKTPFIRLDWDGFLRRFNECEEKDVTADHADDNNERSRPVATKRRNRSYRKVQTDDDETSEPITEITA